MYKIQVYFPELNRWEWLHGLIGELKHSNKKSDAEVYSDDDTEFLEDKFYDARKGTLKNFRKKSVSETEVVNHYVHLIEAKYGSISATPDDDEDLLKLRRLVKAPTKTGKRRRKNHYTGRSRRVMPAAVNGVDFYDTLKSEDLLPLHIKKGDILNDVVESYKNTHSVRHTSYELDMSEAKARRLLIDNKINQNHYHVVVNQGEGKFVVFDKCSLTNVVNELKKYDYDLTVYDVRNIISGHVKTNEINVEMVNQYREVIVDD